ncbi:MAG: hypothetical protein ACXVAY_22430 [Mucilaginibacter sp.]
MKTNNNNATLKLLKRFDNELKKLIAADIKVFRKANNSICSYNNQAIDKQLIAA